MNANYMKDWTVTLAKKDVYFDIDFLSHKYSETSGGENPVRDDGVATETDAAGSKRIVRRLCDNRAADIRVQLARFIKPTSAVSGNDTQDDANWTFNLYVPTEADGSTLAPLAELFHEYIVTGALHDYYAHLGVNANREFLQNRGMAALARIRELIYYRPMP